jgi:3'-phosphoadenosine 5'-phosphosulfate sulfotransferase
MITKEEYVAAIAVIEAYHEQLKATVSMIRNYTEATVSDFIENADISTRLRNAIARSIANRDNDTPILLEELKESDLAIVPNIGRGTVKEFVEKRDSYLRERGTIAPRVAEESGPIFIPNRQDIAV